MRIIILILSSSMAFGHPEPGYAFTNHQSDQSPQGLYSLNNAFTTSFNQVPYDTTGFSQGNSNNNNYHAQDDPQDVTIRQSDNFDLEHSTYRNEEDMMNGIPLQQLSQQPPHSFHHQSGSNQNFNNPLLTGEGNIEPKINEPSIHYVPPKMDGQSNRFIAPSPKISDTLSKYIPPPQSKPIISQRPIILSQPTSPPTQGLQAPETGYIPPQQQETSSYLPQRYISTSGYGYPPARPLVQKHIYVHVPPKEFDDEIPPQHVQVPQAQKHYKIIFIKAPTAPSYVPPIIPPIPQNEEKTLIYVLHKRPDDPEDISLPTAEPTVPTKPEVYFIKYKTRKTQTGLYGAPPSAPSDSAAAGGYGEQKKQFSSVSANNNFENDNNIPTERNHESTYIPPQSLNTTPRASSSYGPPAKSI